MTVSYSRTQRKTTNKYTNHYNTAHAQHTQFPFPPNFTIAFNTSFVTHFSMTFYSFTSNFKIVSFNSNSLDLWQTITHCTLPINTLEKLLSWLHVSFEKLSQVAPIWLFHVNVYFMLVWNLSHSIHTYSVPILKLSICHYMQLCRYRLL
jgi:hypothetical protein